MIVTDEKRLAPAAKPADVAAAPAPSAAPAAEADTSESTPAEATPADPASVEPTPVAARSSDEIAAAATVEAARPEPARAPAASGSSPWIPAAVAAIVVAGLLVVYDVAFRGGSDEAVTALEQRLTAVETTASDAQAAAASAEETAAAAAAEAQSAGEQRLAEIESDIAARLDEIAATAQAAREAAASAPGEERLATLEQRLDALAARIETEIAPVVGGFQEATAQAGDAAQAAQTALSEQQASLTAEMQALRDAVAAEARQTRLAYLGITAANAVVSALPAGMPYAGALATLEDAGISAETRDALAPFAESGAPTAETLRAEFIALAPEIRRALTPEDAGDGVGSFFEGLFARAVRVEPVEGLESPPGETAIDPTAGVARALTIGDLEAALAAWTALPEAARAVSVEFGERLAQRVAAGDAARAAVDEARAALASQDQ